MVQGLSLFRFRFIQGFKSDFVSLLGFHSDSLGLYTVGTGGNEF